MNSLPMRSDQDLARERIEAAIHDFDHCSQCGRPMTVAVRGLELWLECASLREKRGLSFTIATGFHDRHLIELPDGVLAAA